LVFGLWDFVGNYNALKYLIDSKHFTCGNSYK